MATTRIKTITRSWTQAAGPAEEFFLTGSGHCAIEYAMSADTPQIPQGHVLHADESITRSVVGEGGLWLRLTGPGPDTLDHPVTGD